MIRGIILLLFCLAYPTLAPAQDYVPPPLFAAPQEPIKKEPVIAPKEAVPEPSAKPEVKPKPKPLKKKDIPPPPSSRGIVKGPITMPSAPAKSVESEILFEAPEEKIKPLLQQNVTEPVANPSAASKNIPPLPAFKTLSDGVLQSTLYFVSHTTTLSDANQKILDHLITAELNESSGKRLLIQAYASSQANVLNGDRRIALSRALNIRKHLISNNIRTHRIDVRAIGAQTNTQPLDRVELIIR